jgi:glutathione S-transferase
MTPSAGTLYWASNSCAMASHVALEYARGHAGAHYETARLDFSKAQQKSADYLRINPKGRVPALVTAGGILTETPAILLYISQLYPAAKLAPLASPFELARMNAFNSYMCSTVHVHHAHRVRGERWSDDPAVVDKLKLKVPQNMADCFAYIERDYLQGPWVLGDGFCTSDMYLFTIARWLEGDGVDVDTFPKVADHMARMLQLPAVQQVVAQHAAPV